MKKEVSIRGARVASNDGRTQLGMNVVRSVFSISTCPGGHAPLRQDSRRCRAGLFIFPPETRVPQLPPSYPQPPERGESSCADFRGCRHLQNLKATSKAESKATTHSVAPLVSGIRLGFSVVEDCKWKPMRKRGAPCVEKRWRCVEVSSSFSSKRGFSSA